MTVAPFTAADRMPPGWRFVQGETRRLELAEGDWILVKQRLNAGERNKHYERQYTITHEGTLAPNVAMRAGLSMILAYLVEWNLTDATSRIVPLRGLPGEDVIPIMTAALENLDPESYDEVLQAIKRHELEMIAEREAQKKTRRGARESSAISPLPDASTGRTPTSPHSIATSTP
jgi:hypothetical protein